MKTIKKQPKQINFTVPEEWHRKVKAKAALNGKQMKSFIIETMWEEVKDA